MCKSGRKWIQSLKLRKLTNSFDIWPDKSLKFVKMINPVDVWVSLTGLMGVIKCSSAVIIPLQWGGEVRQEGRAGNWFLKKTDEGKGSADAGGHIISCAVEKGDPVFSPWANPLLQCYTLVCTFLSAMSAFASFGHILGVFSIVHKSLKLDGCLFLVYIICPPPSCLSLNLFSLMPTPAPLSLLLPD